MEIINIEQLMRNKLNDCYDFLNGKDKAVARLEEARIAYESAQAAVAQYNDAFIEEVKAYAKDLELKLGIEQAVEAHDEQVVEQPTVSEEIPTDEIIEQPLI